MSINIYAEVPTSDEGTPVMRSTEARLHEEHDGGSYPPHNLVPEAFKDFDGASIRAATLRDRLPETLRLAERRCRYAYGMSHEGKIKFHLHQYTDFVEACEIAERNTDAALTFLASWVARP